MLGIKVELKIDSMGCLIGTPANDQVQALYRIHMVEMGCENANGTIFLQRVDAIESFCDHVALASVAMEHLYNGYTVEVTIDPWDYGHYLGYDAQNVEIPYNLMQEIEGP